ncbi:MAG: type II secretion system protein [Planctomycetota bacterium]
MARLRHGYTVMELLVTITLIALLMALLTPALSSARDQARSIDCISQQQQLRVAWESVLSDRKGRYPLTVSPKTDERWDVLMLEAMGFDLSQPRPIMSCPEAINVYGDVSRTQGYTSYGANTRWSAGEAAGHNEYQPFDMLLAPSKYPLWSDADAFTMIDPPIIYDRIGVTPDDNWRMGFFHPQGLSNVTWGDGHVSSVNRDMLELETDSLGTPVFFLNRGNRSIIALR